MESSGGDDSKKNFVKHVFSFDDDSKSEILNIIQYSLIALIPVVVLNKTMAKYIPEADENKGTLEIVAEVLIQVISMFIQRSRLWVLQFLALKLVQLFLTPHLMVVRLRLKSKQPSSSPKLIS